MRTSELYPPLPPPPPPYPTSLSRARAFGVWKKRNNTRLFRNGGRRTFESLIRAMIQMLLQLESFGNLNYHFNVLRKIYTRAVYAYPAIEKLRDGNTKRDTLHRFTNERERERMFLLFRVMFMKLV